MLETLDLTRSLTKEEYVRDLIRYQVALNSLGYQVYVQRRPVVIVYEGADAGGKGGNIKRVTEKLDPRGYVVHPIAAPKGEDHTHHYLWRFWRRLPERGQIAIFDRSWYGRVMVERIEGFCTEAEWRRAYREINHFERQLVDYGTILFKFYVHISAEEQLARFNDRERTAYKAWKLTDEDWRNRERWAEYVEAVDEMFLRTSTLTAPWTVVEGNSKWYARIKVLRTLVEGLSRELNHYPLAAGDTAEGGEPKSSAAKAKHGGKKKEKKRSKKPLHYQPMVDRCEYGVLTLDGQEVTHDVMILPDGTIAPWEHAEEHTVVAGELEQAIATEPDVLLIGSGMVDNLRLAADASAALQEAQFELIAQRTMKAIETYKELKGKLKVAALLHITC